MKSLAGVRGRMRCGAWLLPALLCCHAAAESLAPFGEGLTVKAGEVKAAKAVVQAVDCLSPAMAPLWRVETPRAGQTAQPFVIEAEGDRRILRITCDELEPQRSTVMIGLPGDGPANGDVWNRNHADYVSFRYKSDKPASMSFHLLQRGKTAGTYHAKFPVEAGEWRKVILPIARFGLGDFRKTSGVGFRVVDAGAGAVVSITDIEVGAMPYSDASWKSRVVSISLNGLWRFAADNDDQGLRRGWNAEDFDAASWKTLTAGKSWQEQDVICYGWGWYQQKIHVPAACQGVAMTLTLTKIASDDDVWINGRRVGGLTGNYRYNNMAVRSYTVAPSLIHYGADNTITVRIWSGNVAKNGLTSGPLTATFDPYDIFMRDSANSAEVPAQLYDLSDARQGKPFQIVIPFPGALAADGTQLQYRITDMLDNEIRSGSVPLTAGADQTARGVVAIDRDTAQTIYLRGRLKLVLMVVDRGDSPLYAGARTLERPSYAKRDATPLPALADAMEDTPYGRLKLVDDIDCATSLIDDPHPYLQSGPEKVQAWMTPGSPVDVRVTDILGKKGRESGTGWFAYRVGRGKLKPHTTYLLRIEYPEDKPRYSAVEVQTGQNYTDVGWKNGVGADSPYDPWPLSGKWQWYDVIVPLDDQTTGAGGTESASAVNGFWVYFLNKLDGKTWAMYSGGPAVARIKLYEIDPQADAPVIRTPQGLPHRVLSFDWERHPDHDPADLVRYAKLMGYNAISPVILKWHFGNYSDPLSGYWPFALDSHDYPLTPPEGFLTPGKTTPVFPHAPPHDRYLQATKQYGIDYIPRIEWGGSLNLPEEAYAIDISGKPVKPTRYAAWGADLLHPLAWDDLKKLIDHLVAPYAADNPQFTGVLWRIRSQRLSISYSRADFELFAAETHTQLPPGGQTQWAAWATGEGKEPYETWWHRKRAEFHIRLAQLLRSYRSDMTLYYYNWDTDKFGIYLPDLTAWGGILSKLGPLDSAGARAVYQAEQQERRRFTARDYIQAMHSGDFSGPTMYGMVNRADLGIRPELYKDAPGIQLFAPINYLCYADKPAYLDYFKTADGLAVSNCISYDELAGRSINPKYECNEITPAGAPFSMALEVLSYFNGDARTLNYTSYTYGRGFADAHRRFAQAFLALPAIPATVIDQGDPDIMVRTYPSPQGTYVGAAHKGFTPATFTIKIPVAPGTPGAKVTNLVTGQPVPVTFADGALQFELRSGPMELNAFLIQ